MAVPGKSSRKEHLRGDKGEWLHTFTVRATGVAYDQSGKTWRAMWRAAKADGSFDFDGEILAESVIVDTDAADGLILETLPASQARQLTAPVVWVDLEATLISDPEDVRTWVRDKVKIVGDPSHD